MSSTIELNLSKMEIRYRVMALAPSGWKMLYSTFNLQDAESYCWKWNGPFHELYINKVWIKSGTPLIESEIAEAIAEINSEQDTKDNANALKPFAEGK